MNNHAKSLVTIMIAVAFSALILRIAIEQFMRFSLATNDAEALSTIKLVATALENHAKDFKGAYPKSITALTVQQPPYLDKDYMNGASWKGYMFNCSRLDPSGYNCSALPVKCNVTGSGRYYIATGGVLVSESCSKKE